MPVTDEQRARLEQRLKEERARAVEVLTALDRRLRTSSQDAAGDLTSVPLHPADQGTDAFAREMDAEEETRVGRELAEIDAALARLYATPERFGIDERTGEDIPLARLELVPWARFRTPDEREPPTGTRRA